MSNATFAIGKTYKMNSICDQECIWEFKVIKRTAKRVTISSKCEGIKLVGISSDEDGEYCYPLGRYSMAPILRAKREV